MEKRLAANLRAIKSALDGNVAPLAWKTLPLPTSEHFDERFRGRSDESIVLDCLRGSFMAVSRIIGFALRKDDKELTDARDAFVYCSMLLERWASELEEHVEPVLPRLIGLVSERPAKFAGISAVSSTALAIKACGAVLALLSNAASGASASSLDQVAGSFPPRLDKGLMRAKSGVIMTQVARVLAGLPWQELSDAVRIEMALSARQKPRRRKALSRATSPQAEAHAFNLKQHKLFPRVVDRNGELTDNAAQVLRVLPGEEDEETPPMTEKEIVDAADFPGPDVVKKVMPGLRDLKLIVREEGKQGARRTAKGGYVLARKRLAIDWPDIVGGTGSGTD